MHPPEQVLERNNPPIFPEEEKKNELKIEMIQFEEASHLHEQLGATHEALELAEIRKKELEKEKKCLRNLLHEEKEMLRKALETIQLEEEKKNEMEVVKIQLEEIKASSIQRNANVPQVNENQILEELKCDICLKTLNIKDLDCHDCKCIFCREIYPSNILLEHYDVCPVNKALELKNKNNHSERRPIIYNRIAHPLQSERVEFSFPRILPESNAPLRNSPFQQILSPPILKKASGQLLTKEKIENLPIMSYVMRNRDGEGEEPKCMVCMEEFLETENLRVLTCFHKYHVACIDQWLKMKNFCPICKEAVNI